LNKCMEAMNSSLNSLFKQNISRADLVSMKKFIADMHLLDNCEINFFTAFRCDKNQIFY